MKLGQTIKALILSPPQRTIPELHAAEDVLKIIWGIADQCRKLVSHKKYFPQCHVCV
jgi:hypothetical protein